MLTPADIGTSPNPLARHYSKFRVADRLFLTGHSHQAWPDVGFEGQVEAWNDAAELVDEKWTRAGEKADVVRRGFARLLGDRDGAIALGQNTHELVVRFLSAMPLRERPRLVTTDAEFHTLRRQLGEGNCFLRVPPGREHLRPAVTGWFSEFSHLSDRVGRAVRYGDGPARWAGATYDPTSHYRAARVFDFFEREKLTPELLREISGHQIAVLAERFDALGLDEGLITRDRSVPLTGIGGFLALESPRADAITAGLRSRGVLVDFRGDLLRLGPAPYLSDVQLHAAMDALAEAARAL